MKLIIHLLYDLPKFYGLRLGFIKTYVIPMPKDECLNTIEIMKRNTGLF